MNSVSKHQMLAQGEAYDRLCSSRSRRSTIDNDSADGNYSDDDDSYGDVVSAILLFWLLSSVRDRTHQEKQEVPEIETQQDHG